jgi:hypothetical protein
LVILIAKNKKNRIIHVAKNIVINQDNISIHLFILSISNSNSISHRKEKLFSFFVIKSSSNCSLLNHESLDISLGFNADKNIIDILIAKTIKTGAKISLTI